VTNGPSLRDLERALFDYLDVFFTISLRYKSGLHKTATKTWIRGVKRVQHNHWEILGTVSVPQVFGKTNVVYNLPFCGKYNTQTRQGEFEF
jgi:hypothetical protein